MGPNSEFKKPRWYVNIFDEMGANWEAIVNMRDTEREADFIEDVMPRKGITLDLCCGTGRHSIVLCHRTRGIVGMDLSKRLLAIAKERMRKADVRFPLVRADMQYFPFRNEVFNGIINMFTSFGYLPSEREDVKSLSEVNRTLRRSGRFLLDVVNRDHVLTSFRERDWAEFEPYYMLERRVFELKDSKLVSQWTLIRKSDGETTSIKHEVRLYTLTRMKQLFEDAGLTVKRVYGGYEKQDFGLDTSRMIILAAKR